MPAILHAEAMGYMDTKLHPYSHQLCRGKTAKYIVAGGLKRSC